MTNLNKAGGKTDSLPVPSWIYLIRHLAGVAVASAVLHYVLHRGDSNPDPMVLDWALKLIAVLTFAFVVNGAWAVFFAARSKGHFSENLVRLVWAMALLVALGEGATLRGPSGSPGASLYAGMHQHLAESKAKEWKVDELRRLYPRFTNLSDAEVLRLVAADYPEQPMDRIAADLGLKVVRSD